MDEIIDRLKKVRRGAMFIIEAPSGRSEEHTSELQSQR